MSKENKLVTLALDSFNIFLKQITFFCLFVNHASVSYFVILLLKHLLQLLSAETEAFLHDSTAKIKRIVSLHTLPPLDNIAND